MRDDRIEERGTVGLAEDRRALRPFADAPAEIEPRIGIILARDANELVARIMGADMIAKAALREGMAVPRFRTGHDLAEQRIRDRVGIDLSRELGGAAN